MHISERGGVFITYLVSAQSPGDESKIVASKREAQYSKVLLGWVHVHGFDYHEIKFSGAARQVVWTFHGSGGN